MQTPLANLYETINAEAGELQDLVLEKALDLLFASHLRRAGHVSCPCTFCQALKDYVAYKLRIHHLKKRINNDCYYQYDEEGPYSLSDAQKRLNELTAQAAVA